MLYVSRDPDSSTSGIRDLVRLGGGAGVNLVIECGNSHLWGRLLCLCLTSPIIG